MEDSILKNLNIKQSLARSVVDQLESLLYENIDEIINLIENNDTQLLIDKHGEIEASLITYAYSTLILNTSELLLSRMESNSLDINDAILLLNKLGVKSNE